MDEGPVCGEEAPVSDEEEFALVKRIAMAIALDAGDHWLDYINCARVVLAEIRKTHKLEEMQ